MFEKEAEEYCMHQSLLEDVRDNICKAFEDGAEFGYNKAKVEEVEEEKCELLGIIQDKDKAIQELKKEIAELKDKLEILISVGNTCTKGLSKQLTKAKEIIKDYLTIVKGNHTTVCSVPEENRTIYVLKLNKEAEQFLNGEVYL